jgi:NTP pyrophosphatase (non-canonical NTP hydrolase)
VSSDVGYTIFEYRATLRARKPIGYETDGFMLGVEHYTIDVISALNFLRDQAQGDSRRWFPSSADSLQHMVLSTCGEVGEMANALKKGLREPFDYDKAIEEVKIESIDVLIYLLNIWAILGVDPAHELAIKRALNEERFGLKSAEV